MSWSSSQCCEVHPVSRSEYPAQSSRQSLHTHCSHPIVRFCEVHCMPSEQNRPPRQRGPFSARFAWIIVSGRGRRGHCHECPARAKTVHRGCLFMCRCAPLVCAPKHGFIQYLPCSCAAPCLLQVFAHAGVFFGSLFAVAVPCSKHVSCSFATVL